MNIRIISRPDGEAPKHIRDKWIGLVLPADPDAEPVLPVAGVISRKFAGNVRGYVVSWEDAMAALDEDSRKWWHNNVIHFSRLIFDAACCEIVS